MQPYEESFCINVFAFINSDRLKCEVKPYKKFDIKYPTCNSSAGWSGIRISRFFCGLDIGIRSSFPSNSYEQLDASALTFLTLHDGLSGFLLLFSTPADLRALTFEQSRIRRPKSGQYKTERVAGSIPLRLLLVVLLSCILSVAD